MRCVAKNTMLEKIMLIRVAAEVNFGNVEASGASNSIPRGERNECGPTCVERQAISSLTPESETRSWRQDVSRGSTCIRDAIYRGVRAGAPQRNQPPPQSPWVAGLCFSLSLFVSLWLGSAPRTKQRAVVFSPRSGERFILGSIPSCVLINFFLAAH